MRRAIGQFAALLAAAALLGQPVAAQNLRFQTDATAPIDLVADKLVWQQENGRADLTGAARISQGAVTLYANYMQITLAADGTAQSLKALGDVVMSDGTQTARAMQADYDVQQDVMLLSGQVVVSQAATNNQKAGTLSGATLRLNMADGRAQLSGGSKSRARIQLGK